MVTRHKSESNSKSAEVVKQATELDELKKSLARANLQCESLTKEKDFLQYRVQRLENQSSKVDKAIIREEVQRDMDNEHRLRHLIAENDRLKEDLIGKPRLQVLESSNSDLRDENRALRSVKQERVVEIERHVHCKAHERDHRHHVGHEEVHVIRQRSPPRSVVHETIEISSPETRNRSRSGDLPRLGQHSGHYQRYFEGSSNNKAMLSTMPTDLGSPRGQGSLIQSGSNLKKSSGRILVN